MNLLRDDMVSLRALEPDDIEALYHWENHPDVWRVSNTFAPVSKYMLANYIKNADKDIWESKSLRLVIENNKNESVGTVELFDFEPYHQRAGIGIIIFSEKDRRQGYAHHALSLMLHYAYSTIGLVQVYANISCDNTPSIDLFKKLGFLTIGQKKQWLRTADGWKDEMMVQKLLP